MVIKLTKEGPDDISKGVCKLPEFNHKLFGVRFNVFKEFSCLIDAVKTSGLDGLKQKKTEF